MNYKEIKINYMSQKRYYESLGLEDFNSLENLTGFKILENANKPLRLYPQEISSRIEKVGQEHILEKIREIIKSNVKAISLIGYDINYDDIRNIYIPLAIEYNLAISITNFIKEDIQSKITLLFKPILLNLSDEEWETKKMAIKEHISEVINERTQSQLELEQEYGDLLDDEYVNNEMPLDTKTRNELFKLFKANFDDDKKDSSYSFCKNGDNLSVSLTANNTIEIHDNENKVEIQSSHFNFLIKVLEHIIKEQY